VILSRRFISPLAVVLLVAVSTSPLPAQSNATVLAIVGARIVDGSGNEPFDGTVVVRDGRIAEVGRNVRPPDGARIIEGRGRIVAPGLIDVRVHLPAGATDDALARVMAAYLYAGVTSIGLADLDENKVDALRDHLATAKIRAPRLVSAVAPANAMFASALGSAMPDTLAFADWKRRNATFVPELLSRPANDKKAAQDRAKAAQQAGVRIGVGSSAGGSELAPGVSTIREVRLLVESGLTPLQAVTAVTSGSAWALGLQSDRAFLAVGQRGDLAILGAEPNAGGGETTFVEQVFVGGEEIDRAALNAIITRPEPAPPETTSAASRVNGEAAAGTATAAPVKPTAPATTKATRAGRKGRTRAADTPPPATTASEPASAAGSTTSEPTASASATPPAVAPNPAAPPPATPSPTPPSPAPSAATPPRTGAPPTPAPPAPSSPPSASAPTTAEPSPTAAAAGAGAAAPIPLAEPLIDDFENGGDRTGLGSNWNASNDSGTAADLIAGRVIRGLRDHALHLTARMGDAGEPYARVTVSLAQDGHPADVSQFHGLRFDARGQGRYRIVFVTRSVTDGRYHESFFSGSPLWTPVSISFATLGQTGAGPRVKWTGADLLEIAFQFAREPGQMGWLELDNLRFY
jgi:imidazolonepropionase-like amidohydrolase